MPADNEIAHLSSGTLLNNGKYKITRFIGAGGFGCTYEAEFVAMRTRVAIKEFFVHSYCNRNKKGVVSVGTKNQTEFVENLKEKFKREARSLFMLQHPRIVRVTDILEENDTVYFVMDFIDGVSLHTIVSRCGPLPEPTALKYIRQVMDALEYVHSKKMLHLDVKPANIMVDRNDNATLIDFGVSKIYDGPNEQNDSIVTSHTPGFAPPEQIGNELKKFSPAADIYSLGATLYSLLTSKIPPNSFALISNAETLDRLPEFISPETRRAVYAMMQPSLIHRPASIQAVRDLLDGVVPADDEQDTPQQIIFSESQDADTSKSTVPPKTEPIPSNIVEQILNESAVASAQEKKPKKKWIWIAAAALAIIVGGIASIFIAARHGDNITINTNTDTTAQAQDTVPAAPLRGFAEGYQWVDMGTTAKWAVCNIGADSDRDRGQYFAWAETKTKGSYSLSKYLHNGNPPGEIVGNSSFDPARALWGGEWRMPSRADFQELIDVCDWEWDEKGAKVTAPNGNTIFLPAAGFYQGTTLIDNGDVGGYWSATPSDDPHKAWRIHFFKGRQELRQGDCYSGRSVRPVINL